jgi:hypothetical protein
MGVLIILRAMQMSMLALLQKLFDGENGGAEVWEEKNYGLTVTVFSKPWCPVNRSLSLHQLWVSTALKREAPYQHHNQGLCHLGAVETIMVGSNLTILDQIAKSPCS